METILKYFNGFTGKQLQQFAALYELYVDWNQKINVISRRDMDNFYEHHVLHSLAIAAQFNFPGGYEVMDLGTGGGFPGIPLAIFFPEVHFLLVDSIQKKLKVAEAVVTSIGLKNVTTQHTRAEDIKDKKFDIVVSRAVAPLKDLWFWSKPLLKKKPVNEQKKLTGLVCLKGGDLQNEITESGTRPMTWDLESIFTEAFFKDKYILQITASQ
ncbi:MAG: 16S rRNA (guanine(527)-N(7))-methyltransferase RsmG [Ginsengibacter sp.]